MQRIKLIVVNFALYLMLTKHHNSKYIDKLKNIIGKISLQVLTLLHFLRTMAAMEYEVRECYAQMSDFFLYDTDDMIMK